MLDINSPIAVQVQTDAERSVLWVNIDGVCALRVSQIPGKSLVFDIPKEAKRAKTKPKSPTIKICAKLPFQNCGCKPRKGKGWNDD